MAELSALQGIAALASAATSNSRVKKQIGYQTDAQKDLMKFQNEINIANYERQRADELSDYENYTSLSAQVDQARKAGISADLVAGAAAGNGPSGSASIDGVSQASAPDVEFDPIGDSLKAASAVGQIFDARASLDSKRESLKYDREARNLNLRMLSAEVREQEAKAIEQEKLSGVFDERENRLRRNFVREEERHLFDRYDADQQNARALYDLMLRSRDQDRQLSNDTFNQEMALRNQREAERNGRTNRDYTRTQAEMNRRELRYESENSEWLGKHNPVMSLVDRFMNSDPVSTTLTGVGKKLKQWKDRIQENRSVRKFDAREDSILRQMNYESEYRRGKKGIRYDPQSGIYYPLSY